MAVVKNYAGFSGRAGRKEYWMFSLIYVVLCIAIFLIGVSLPKSVGTFVMMLLMVFSLGLLLPQLAVTIRRLHDTDHSGWFILLSFVPIASFYLLYLLIIEGTQGTNRFGDAPTAILPNSV